MYAARRTEERNYKCTRQQGRKKGFTYVRGKKDGRKDLNMYAARRTEKGFKYVPVRRTGERI